MKAIKLAVVLVVLGFASAASAFTEQTPFWKSLSAEEKEYMPRGETCVEFKQYMKMKKELEEKPLKHWIKIGEKCQAVCDKLRKAHDPNARHCHEK